MGQRKRVRHGLASVVLVVCLILVAAGLALLVPTSEPFAIRWKGAGVSLSSFAWTAMYLAFAIIGALLVTRSASQVVGWLAWRLV
jgi:hypothetical protein